MARSYNLKRRAERQADTRLKIVEAAIELHGSIGPARTSLSMIADRAGVQRNTLYAHFPNERSLGLACSGLFFERVSPPDPAAWGAGPGLMRAALCEIYDWYERAAPMLASVLGDAEHHPPTRELLELHVSPMLARWRDALADGLSTGGRALLKLALSFHTWRTLVQGAGLPGRDAAELMARAVADAGT